MQQEVPFTKHDQAMTRGVNCSAEFLGENDVFEEKNLKIFVLEKLSKNRLRIPVRSVQDPARVLVAVASCQTRS